MPQIVVTRRGGHSGPDATLPADCHEPPALQGDCCGLVSEVLHDTLRAAITDPLENLTLPGVERSRGVHAHDLITNAYPR